MKKSPTPRQRYQPHLTEEESRRYKDGTPLPEGIRRIAAFNKESFLISEEDFDYCRFGVNSRGYPINWSCITNGGNHYFVHTDTNEDGMRAQIILSRVVLYRMGFNNFDCADHITHDNINNDNTRKNLRPLTDDENKQNRRFGKSYTGFTGVAKKLKNGKIIYEAFVYEPDITGKSKYHSLKAYDNAEDAALMRDAFCKLYKPYSKYNFPDRDTSHIIPPVPFVQRMPKPHKEEKLPKNHVRKIDKRNNIGCPCVYFDAFHKNYRVRVHVNGKRKDIGCFQDKDAAIIRYKQWELEHRAPIPTKITPDLLFN
jgi:hypothetical protein